MGSFVSGAAGGAAAGASVAPFTGPAAPFVVAGAALAGGVAGMINGNYQARIAQNNAAIADKNAQWAGQFGDINATNEGLKTRAAIGEQTARTAAAGVETTSGSAASVTEAQRALGEYSALTIRSNASREAYGLRARAQGYRNEAGTARLGGTMDLIRGVGSAAGSFLGNAQSTPAPTPYNFGSGMIGVAQ